MTALLGKIDEFDDNKGSGCSIFFAANGITDAEKQQDVFLAVIGPSWDLQTAEEFHPAKLTWGNITWS